MSKKLIYFHDGPVFKDENGVQFGNTFDLDMFERYQYLADKVEFCQRVLLKEDTEGFRNLNEEGLFTHEITPFNRPHTLHNYFKSKKKIHALVEEADLMIVRVPSTIGSIAYWHGRKTNKPILLEVVGCPWDSLSNHSTLGRIYARFSMKKQQKIAWDADYGIYVSEKFLQSRYPTQGKSAGISDVFLKKAFDENPKLTNYKNIDLDKTINLGTLAAINIRYKGHDLVLKAISELKKKGLKFKYFCAGNGSSERLSNLAEKLGVRDSVEFVGLLDHSEINDLLLKLDIYVQPSRQEGLPRAVVEAMNCGCACIGSSVGGIPELLDDKVIFETDDLNGLIEKLTQYDNQEIFVEQSQKNFETAKKYGYDYLNAKRHSFYDSFLDSISE